MLSAIPNRLFYQSRLLDGCSEKQRRPLVLGVPPLTCIHSPGSCASNNSNQVGSPSLRGTVICGHPVMPILFWRCSSWQEGRPRPERATMA